MCVPFLERLKSTLFLLGFRFRCCTDNDLKLEGILLLPTLLQEKTEEETNVVHRRSI
jgi:hypothetical protein